MELTKEEIILVHQVLLAPRFQTLAEAQIVLALAQKIQLQVNEWEANKKIDTSKTATEQVKPKNNGS